MSRRHRGWHVWGVAVLAACVPLAAACGGASGSEERSATTTTEAPSTTEPPATTTSLDPQAQALADAEAAYLAYEEAYNVAAADPVTPQHPALQALITGDKRINTVSDLGGDLADGEALRHAQPSQFSVDVLSAVPQSDGSVLLRVCRVDDRVVYKVATGEVVDADVVTRTIEAVMANDSGAWKVALTTSVADVAGVASCVD